MSFHPKQFFSIFFVIHVTDVFEEHRVCVQLWEKHDLNEVVFFS